MSGRLVVVATPIGNLGDLSPRAVAALGAADVVACEDTRRTRKLFSHAGLVTPPMEVVNDHTEVARTTRLLDHLAQGRTVVLVSDAGMPLVSDPGEYLVAAVVDAGHPVEIVPGPSAALSALAISGLPTGRFSFEGFLPRRGSARRERVAAVAGEDRTVVLYEAPHRLSATLDELVAAAGADRPVAIARELTKLHEEVYRGDLAGARDWAAGGVKGEVVLVLGSAPSPAEIDDAAIVDAVRAARAGGASHAAASRAVSTELGVSRRRVYELTLDRD